MSTGFTRPNCYECKHRRPTPGDSHSRCAHPMLGETETDPLRQLLSLLGAMPMDEGTMKAVVALDIRANPHGVRNGWFHWPVNFDPVWLDSCKGFEPINPPAAPAETSDAKVEQ